MNDKKAKQLRKIAAKLVPVGPTRYVAIPVGIKRDKYQIRLKPGCQRQVYHELKNAASP